MRQPITLKIKFKSASLDQFIERYSVDVSKGGIFIRTKEPLPVGTNLKFEFQLQDSSSLISGEGTVVWTREHDPARAGVAPGMGVRFDKVSNPSSGVLDQILAEKTRRGESQVESRFDAGIRATSPAAPRRDFDASDPRSHTPLPKPSPGFDGAEEEFGQESTRVMQDEVVQRLAEKTREQKEQRAGADEAFSDEPTRARSAEEIDKLVRESGRDSTAANEAVTRQVPVLSSAAPPTPTVDPLAKTSIDKSPLPPPPAHKPEPKVEVAPAMTAPAPVIAAVPLEPREARPPQKKSGGSPLPAVLGIGIVIAGIVGYVVYSPKSTQDPAVKPAEPQIAQAPETPKPVEAPPTTAPTTPTPTSPTTNAPVEPAKPAGVSVAVTSEPPGATITVDGTAKPAATPTTLEGLDAKTSYEVVVSLKGFHDWKTKLTPKEGGKIEAKLVANEKVVEVASTPAGADVFLDGKKLGKTPYVIKKIDVSADHNLELRHAGFDPQTRAISAGDGWEAKDGKDVLAVALTLNAVPPKPKAVPVAKPAKPSKPTEAKPTSDAPTAETPTEPKAEDKPAVEKPVEDKPVEKADKPEKPAPEKKTDKKAPSEDDKAIKTPDFMKGGEGGEAQ